MRKKLLSFFIVITCLLFVLLLSTLTITNLKFIYNHSIDNFQLVKRGGISKDEIIRNYSYITDYILSKNKSDKFELPTLKYSEDGAIHFYEVRQLFNLAKGASATLFITLVLLMRIYYKKFKDLKPLKFSGLTLIFMPLIVALIVSINFKFFFTIFHKIFFNNDKWLFNPITDPIINLLPEEFFALCGTLIILLTVVSGVVLLLGYITWSARRVRESYITLTSDK